MQPMHPDSRRDVGYQLHLQQRDRVLDLQLALLEPAKLDLVDTRLPGQPIDDFVEIAMLNLQFDDPPLDLLRLHGLQRVLRAH